MPEIGQMNMFKHTLEWTRFFKLGATLLKWTINLVCLSSVWACETKQLDGLSYVQGPAAETGCSSLLSALGFLEVSATSLNGNGGLVTRTLLVTKGIATRSKNTSGSWDRY